MLTGTQALNRSMSQLGHNPHSYNPVNYQCHYHWARSRKLSMSTHGYNPVNCQCHYHWARSSTRMFQRGPAMNVNRDTSS